MSVIMRVTCKAVGKGPQLSSVQGRQCGAQVEQVRQDWNWSEHNSELDIHSLYVRLSDRQSRKVCVVGIIV